MSMPSDFHGVWGKLASGLPMAIEVAEFMGSRLPAGSASGDIKLAGVLGGMAPILSQYAAFSEGAPTAAEGQAAVTDLVNAAVKLRNVWAKPAPAAEAGAGGPVLVAPPVSAVVGPSSTAEAPPATADQSPDPGPEAPAVDPAAEPRPYVLPPGAQEVKVGVICIGNVRLVWDYQSERWATTP